MSLLKQRLSLAFDQTNSDNVINSPEKETTDFIKAVESLLISMCSVKKETTVPKHQMMNIPKLTDIKLLIKWLNSEKIPFELIQSYSNGIVLQNSLRFITKDVLLTIGQYNFK